VHEHQCKEMEFSSVPEKGWPQQVSERIDGEGEQ
jgi:hypothetical protein